MPRFFALSVCLAALLLTACGVSPGSLPTLTPDPALPATAAALFPTAVPTSAPTPTPLAAGGASEAIARLLRAMQSAVITRNPDAYLALVDLSDPVFALEHTRWVEDWNSALGAVLRYELALRNLTVSADGREAAADLTVNWTSLQGNVSRGADFPARFTLGEDGLWRYAGERWATMLETDHFLLRAMPGLERRMEQVAAFLPQVYARVTEALGYEPAGRLEIKLYNNPWSLSATTRLSLTEEIAGWNEPGEALKIVGAQADDEGLIAHEFAHYLTFDMAGTTRGGYPWWLSEGISRYAESLFRPEADRNAWLAAVRDRRRAQGLVAWEDMAVFERTPEALWPFAYLQGYAFIAYVTETRGAEVRNAWIRAMATGDLESATQTALDVSFGDLDRGFRAWLDASAS